MRTKLLLMVVAPLLAAEALSAQSGPRVTFKFDWKPGTVAEITSVTAMSGMNPTAPGDTSSTIVRSTLRRTIEAHPRGLLVRSAPVELKGAPATVAAGAAAAGIGAANASAMIVGTDGRFVALGDTVHVRRIIDSTLQSMQATLGALPPAVRASMESMLTMESMTAASKLGWDQASERFLGRNWTVGETVKSTIEMPFPAVPGRTVKADVHTTLVSVVPCDGATPAVRCALVQHVMTLDRAGMRSTMAEMIAGMGMDPSSAAGMVPESSNETVGEVLLEVATMLPRRTSSKTVHNTSAMGIQRRTEVTTITTYNYTSR